MPELHVPEIGSKLSVTLPREITRATVVEVVDDHHVHAKLDVMEPMAKTHNYFFGDTVLAERRRGMGDTVIWEVTKKVE
jgi:hypothetical protein